MRQLAQEHGQVGWHAHASSFVGDKAYSHDVCDARPRYASLVTATVTVMVLFGAPW
jgi:hypothetical protein